MKPGVRILIFLSALLVGSAGAEPKYTKEQVIAMGRVILAAEVNKEYKASFWDAEPTYDEKAKSWSYLTTRIPVTPGGSVHTFEIREADAHYRLGWVSGTEISSGYDKFRIQASVRGKLMDLLASYEKP